MAANKNEVETDEGPDLGLVRHKARPEWGPAIVLHQEEDRRTYLFKDGTKRTFKEGFFHFFEPVSEEDLDEPVEVVLAAIEANYEEEERAGRPSLSERSRQRLSWTS